MNQGLRTRPNEDKLKELTQKYNKPANVSSLKVPRVNLGIWRQMTTRNKDVDLKLQHLQNLLSKAACPMMYMMDMFLQKSSNQQPITIQEVQSYTVTCKDTYQMLQASFSEITFRRRSFIKGDIQPQYKALCDDTTPVTDMLFGDDIKEKIKEMDAENSVFKKVGHEKSTGFHQSARGRDSIQEEKERSKVDHVVSASDVSTNDQLLDISCEQLQNFPNNFIGGKISLFFDRWKELTSDYWILDIIKGYKLEFENIPTQINKPHPLVFNAIENQYVQQEIDKFITKRIIQPVTQTEDQYVSNIFVRPKKDGTYRVILNLKQLNLDIEHIHFKMETFKTAVTSISKNCWFGSVDLKDAYYSVKVDKNDRKYLRFYWKHVLYEYTCLPNGLTTAPRIFTKILKVVFSKLRSKGHCNTPYIDDSLLVSKTYAECQKNITDTVKLLDYLGFTIHPDKSVLQPTQIIVFLGFVINSLTMRITLTEEKADNIAKLCSRLILKKEITIREFAQVIGKLVATQPGVQFAPLYIKSLEITKDILLKCHYGNFDAKMILSEDNISDLNWWVNNVKSSFNPINQKDPDFILKTDSSSKGWGAVVQDTLLETKGFWSYEEQKNHINFLELKAVLLALKWFCSSREKIHIQVYVDNMVALNYINKMGGRILKLNTLTKELWNWCINRKIWVTAFYLPGVANIEADRLSRSINVDIEWKLNENVFHIINSLFGPHDLDLFASKINHQLPRYYSYFPDSYAEAVDAFSVQWNNINCYCFPPFSLIGKILQKVDKDKADMTLVAPLWNTQNWFPLILHRIVADSFMINSQKNLLYQPQSPTIEHHIVKLKLAVFRISGNCSKVMDYQKKLPTLLHHRRNQLPNNNIGHIAKDGCHFAVKGKSIYLKPLS
ncbi:unnamed protein product [Mytilus edulis]|uniref:Reverse transcriptase domain-containing protein n=1 Tax=Mytilus edulis TaxID=6550 RepID=A0A8S3S3M7_MYTED|nr:unnamed protein product [Mytilus edulis]